MPCRCCFPVCLYQRRCVRVCSRVPQFRWYVCAMPCWTLLRRRVDYVGCSNSPLPCWVLLHCRSHLAGAMFCHER